MMIRIRWLASAPRIVMADACWGQPASYLEVMVPTATDDVDVNGLLLLLRSLESAVDALSRK